MKFSIVIPTYNRADDLFKSLQALVNQTFKDFEVIICDDGSTDHTKCISEKFNRELEIRYFYSENWGGPARPRNTGILNASADWICFLDSDDIWYPEKLQEVLKVIDKDNSDVICHLFETSTNRKILGNYKKSFFYNRFTDLLINGNGIVNSSLTIRKGFLLKVGNVSEDKGLIGVEDYDLLIKLAYEGAKFHCIKKCLGMYNIHANNISSDSLLQIEKISYLLGMYSSNINEKLKDRIAGLLSYLTASHYIDFKKSSKAKEFLVKSIRYGSVDIRMKAFIKLLLNRIWKY